MKQFIVAAMAAALLVLNGCGQEQSEESPGGTNAAESNPVPFIVMDESLTALKEDFNAASETVRLLFLSGPTCGICLRGLSDMNAELLEGNTDPRLRTFVVHQPTLKADEQDARNSTILIDNPHTRHYWEETGVIGQLYREVMDLDYYAWDMWFIYRPDARWEGEMPPEPDFWMHQLRPLPKDRYLDAEVFASKANEWLESLPPPDRTPARLARQRNSLVKVETVAQPAGVALEQHITGRGGYRNLAAIESVRMEGTIDTGNGRLPLVVQAHRDGSLTRQVGEVGSETVARRDDGGSVSPPSGNSARGMPWALERRIMESFEIDGALVDWKDKGHGLESTIGMVRMDDSLAWELDLIQTGVGHWRVYVDSHSGMELRRHLVDDSGRTIIDMRFGEYRIAEPDTPHPSRFDARERSSKRGFYGKPGLVFPYRVEYRDAEGGLLATERFEFINADYTGEAE